MSSTLGAQTRWCILTKFLKLYACLLDSTIGVKATLAPCDVPAFISLDITEEKLHIDFPIAALVVGSAKVIPIPGLVIGIPEIGDAGLFAAVKFLGACARVLLLCRASDDPPLPGNPSELEIDLGLDACAQVGGFQVCGSALLSDLPLWILRYAFNFSSICK